MWFLDQLFRKSKEKPRIDLTRRFDLLNPIGQGTMSRVWKATDTSNGQTVCVKVLDKDKTELLEQKFKNLPRPSEGEIALSMQHPHIVRTLECGLTKQNEQFLVMDYIDGAGLSVYVEMQNEAMKKHRLDWMIELGEAIQHFHTQGYIHRDLCPHNVLLDRQYSIKLIDFGLAVPDKPEFRVPGNRTGKASYMAPELIKRQATDKRIDVFSYAVTCYEMCCKQLPFEGGQSLQVVVQSMNRPPKDLLKLAPEIDPAIVAVIMKGLNKEPDQRWSTAQAMVREFSRIKNGG
jgi:serine/threonine protein kinase